jgi:TFIIF-interacting CTD phosphatase-like protein
MNKNPGRESVDAEGSMEPLASIENSKRDHTIYLDNEDGVYSFLPVGIMILY